MVNIKRLIPLYVDYAHPSVQNIIMKEINAESYRKSWIENCIGLDKLSMLLQHPKVPSGIIIIDPDATRDLINFNYINIKLGKEILNKDNAYIPKIPISKETGKVNDLYVDSLNEKIGNKYKYEYVLIYVNVNLHKDMLFGPREQEQSSTEQLINVIIIGI